MAHVRHRLIDLIAAQQAKEQRLIKVFEIAKNSGVPRPTLQYWLDNPVLSSFGADTIVGLCRYFECGVGDLLVIEE